MLCSWRDGDIFTMSLRASPLEIFRQLSPFLDWLRNAMCEELAKAQAALMLIEYEIASDLMRLQNRHRSMHHLGNALSRVNSVIDDGSTV